MIFYIVTINVLGFLCMFIDKRNAKFGKSRIPESTLIFISILLGSIGIILGMWLFHHKIKHIKFFLGVPTILAIQIIAYLIFYFLR